jgi:hypothetical protein
MLIHKTCALSEAPEGEQRRGVYFLGNVSMSFDLTGTPSGMGGVQIGIANDYSLGDGGSYISSIECYDCGKTVNEFVSDIEPYKLERILDVDADQYDLAEDDGK